MILTTPKHTLLAIAILLLSASACQRDDTIISSSPALLYETISQQAEFLGSEEQAFAINVNEDQAITGTESTSLTIPQDIFETTTGASVNGTVDLKLKEVLTKSEMILSNITSESGGVLLETIGSFRLSATQDGNDLNINQEIGVTLNMNSNVTEPNSLGVYYSDPADDNVNWMLDSGSQVPLSAGVHSFDVDRLAWVSVAKPVVSTTTHQLNIRPEVITTINDQAGYLVFDNLNTVASLNPAGNQFVRNDVPEGETATVVMIAIDPLFIYLSIVEDVNLISDKSMNVVYNVVSEEQLIAALSALN